MMSNSASSCKIICSSEFRKTQADQQLQRLLTTQPIMRPSLSSCTTLPRHWTWWLVMAIYMILLLAGQTAATLLQRFYYNQGGNSKWMQTLTFSAGFPILYIPLLLTPSTSYSTEDKQPLIKISLIYIAIGLITTADSLMYSYGLLFLTVSTYSLVSTTQLAFNAVFSYFINSEKFTHLTLNSIIILTFSAAILGVHSDQDHSSSSDNISGGKYVLGFMLTLAASATYAFILSLMELTFQKVIKRQTVKAVLEMQIYTALVSTVGAMVGLFASKEWKGLRQEMEGFGKGRVGYVMTLVWASVAWQVTNVGLVGLIFKVSSLFSNVISTLGTPIVPVFAVFLFHDKMDGLKIISLLLGLWGFTSYFYQHYIDYIAEKKDELQESGRPVENEISAI